MSVIVRGRGGPAGRRRHPSEAQVQSLCGAPRRARRTLTVVPSDPTPALRGPGPSIDAGPTGGRPARILPASVEWGWGMSLKSYDWIAHHGRTRPDKVAMIDLRSGRRRHLRGHAPAGRSAVRSAPAATSASPAATGVAVYSHNDTNTFEVQFACWRLGAVFVPLNWRLAIPELDFIVRDCGPKVMFHEPEFAESAAAICAGAGVDAPGQLGRPVSRGGRLRGRPGQRGGRLRPGRDQPRHHPHHHVHLRDDRPAQGRHDHPRDDAVERRQHDRGVRGQLRHRQPGGPADVPHRRAQRLRQPAFHLGGSNVVMHAFDPDDGLRVLSDPQIGITHFLGVPANWLFMSQAPAFAEVSFPSLVAAGVGGSPTPAELIKVWLDKGVPLQQAYGMTETSPLVLALSKEDAARKIGSAGLPVMHTECRIVDEIGADVGPGAVGELWVRGPNVTPGYWNRPEASADAFTGEWLHTGDAARQDEDGYFYIVDRWKDMYISGGENVYPAEVENVLYDLAGVAEAAVIGVPDDRWVEVGKAFVVARPGADA